MQAQANVHAGQDHGPRGSRAHRLARAQACSQPAARPKSEPNLKNPQLREPVPHAPVSPNGPSLNHISPQAICAPDSCLTRTHHFQCQNGAFWSSSTINWVYKTRFSQFRTQSELLPLASDLRRTSTKILVSI
ncbi:hypothetical protein FNV43_RR12870 [Rhamnella rubrinervis]|uniref:Uncharacterized protein n=1 Tax=Rhamnella rubrinervis TaxID=2594499 RepID=A0A8K0H007_9ROSA|nr:hypothetical protein FNV43_RR12870 [Rhamnella rubrinervis]